MAGSRQNGDGDEGGDESQGAVGEDGGEEEGVDIKEEEERDRALGL